MGGWAVKCLWRLIGRAVGKGDLTKKFLRKSFCHWDGIYCVTDLSLPLDYGPLKLFTGVLSMLQAYNNAYAMTTHREEK